MKRIMAVSYFRKVVRQFFREIDHAITIEGHEFRMANVQAILVKELARMDLQ